MKNKYAIGIDLGGTKVLGGIIDKTTGEVLYKVKNKTKKEKGEEKITSIIFETIDELLTVSKFKKEDISSIGIGAAGQVDREKGILISAINLNCKDLNLKDLIEEKFGIKTYIGNDVEVAALGELNFGAGKNFKDIVCVFVGTGIGSSIIKDGKIHYGASGTAGEIGHMIVDLNGRACACGANGCLEAYASRSAIESRILGAIKKGRKSIITDFAPKLSSISSKHIKQSLDAHDEVVSQYVNEAVSYLSGGLASVMNFYNPELIILGGGLIQSVDEFYLETIRKAKVKALPTPAKNIQFKRAELGDYSGIIGAALLEDVQNDRN
ncbi:MAG: ROK family protein [Cyanobacteria bacterium SIG30]|nr:ROK family protein [Cyanobacteria bacterium SIG30]